MPKLHKKKTLNKTLYLFIGIFALFVWSPAPAHALICLEQNVAYFVECKNGDCIRGLFTGHDTCSHLVLDVSPLSKNTLNRIRDFIIEDGTPLPDGIYHINAYPLTGNYFSHGPYTEFKDFEALENHWQGVAFQKNLPVYVIILIRMMLFFVTFVLSLALIIYLFQKLRASLSSKNMDKNVHDEKKSTGQTLLSIFVKILLILPITIILIFFAVLVFEFLVTL